MRSSEHGVAEHFDARAATYAHAATWVNDQVSMDPLGDLVDRVRPRTLLELGSGSGAVPTFLRATGRHVPLYVALDLSFAMLRQQRGGGLIQADAAHLPVLSCSVDVVLGRQVFHYLPRPDRVLSEAHRALTMRGRLAIAQIVPFDEADDEEWWRGTVRLRQPLRIHACNTRSLTQDLRAAGFSLEGVTFIERRSSLRDWLDRYPLTADKRERLVDHFRHAPKAVRDHRGFTGAGEDVEYTIRWFVGTAAPSSVRARQR